MILSDVSTEDCKMLAQLINMLHSSELTLNGKDICASADTIRWLQRLAKQAAEVYAKPKEEELTIKAMSPGKVGKSK